MEVTRELLVPAPVERTFALVDDLTGYPSWMGLVHTATATEPAAVEAPDLAVWIVELRAKVGPLARSKRLRMARTVHVPHRRVVFERAEIDARAHAPWMLSATLEATMGADRAAATNLTMRLSYGGRLWTGGLLERVLDDEIGRGSEALVELAGS